MGVDDVEIVRRFYDAIGRKDFDTMFALAHDDAEWDLREAALDERVYRGHEGLREYFVPLWEVAPEFSVDVQDLAARGDRVIARVRVLAQGRSSGIDTARSYGAVWTLRDGKIAAMRVYADPDEALSSSP